MATIGHFRHSPNNELQWYSSIFSFFVKKIINGKITGLMVKIKNLRAGF